MLPEDPRHGTEAGHEQHLRDGEKSCADCYTAKLKAGRRRSKRKAMGHRYTVPAEEARAKLQRWRDGGATFGEIADHIGVAESRAWEILRRPGLDVYTRTSVAVLSAPGWPVTALGVTRRVRALCRLGWTTTQIAEACGVHSDTVVDLRRRQAEFVSRKVRTAIVTGYETLSGRLPEPKDGRARAATTRARNDAERRGWPAPLAWDDIDDPHEKPDLVERRRVRSDYDPVVVERFLGGEHSIPTTVPERAEIVRRWPGSLSRLEDITNWNTARYKRKGAA